MSDLKNIPPAQMPRRNRHKRASSWALLALIVMVCASLYLWLGCRQVVCGAQESTKHIIILEHVWSMLQLNNWRQAVATNPYPPGNYLTVCALGCLCGRLSESLALLAQIPYIILSMWGTYRLTKLFTKTPEALVSALLTGAVIVFHLIKMGYLLDYLLLAWVSWSLYFLYASHHFTRLRPCLGLGLTMGLGMMHKCTYFIYVLGAFLVEGVYLIRWRCRGRAEGARSLRNHFKMALRSLLVMALICLPWYLAYGYDLVDYAVRIQAEHPPHTTPVHSWHDLWLCLLSLAIDIQHKFDLAFDSGLYLNCIYGLSAVGFIYALFQNGKLRHEISRYSLVNFTLNFLISLILMIREGSEQTRFMFPLIYFCYLLAIFWFKDLKWLRIPSLLVFFIISCHICWAWLLPNNKLPLQLAKGAPFSPAVTGGIHLRDFRDPLGIFTEAHLSSNENIAATIGKYVDLGYTPVILPESNNWTQCDLMLRENRSTWTEICLSGSEQFQVFFQDPKSTENCAYILNTIYSLTYEEYYDGDPLKVAQLPTRLKPLYVYVTCTTSIKEGQDATLFTQYGPTTKAQPMGPDGSPLPGQILLAQYHMPFDKHRLCLDTFRITTEK